MNVRVNGARALAMDPRPVKVYSCPLPSDSRERLQQTWESHSKQVAFNNLINRCSSTGVMTEDLVFILPHQWEDQESDEMHENP